MRNIFYFRKISKIGGTEQFLYEIAKKYRDWDITIFYQEGYPAQIKRLKEFVRVRRWKKGEKIKCDRAFLNFNAEILEDLDCPWITFVSHANWEEIGYKPPIKGIEHFIGVSKFSARKLEEYAKSQGRDIKVEVCYNPLSIEKVEKVPIIVSACRLDDEVKGGKRTLALIEALDRYCAENGRQYLWLIFTNHTDFEIESPNAVYMKARIDVRPYIAMADWVAQLSNDMETYCYTTNEASSYGVPIITTPLSVYEELPKCERLVLEWDCSNVDEIARKVFEYEPKEFKYTPPKDEWDKFLEPGESTYKKEPEKTVKLRCTYFLGVDDLETEKHIEANEVVDVTEDRAEELLRTGCFEVVE